MAAAKAESGHRYTQTPIRFTEADQARIKDLQSRHLDELSGERRSVADIVRMALLRWWVEGNGEKKTGKRPRKSPLDT